MLTTNALNTVIVGAFGGIIAGAAIMTVFRPDPGTAVIQSEAGVSADTQSQIVSLRAEIDSLRQSVQPVEGHRIASEGDAAASPRVDRIDPTAQTRNKATQADEGGTTIMPTDEDLSRELDPDQIKAQVEEQFARQEDVILAEEVDPNWAPSAEAEFTAAFKSEELRDFGIEDTQCRSTACVLRVSLGSLNPAEGVDLLIHRRPFQGETSLWVRDDDPSRVIVYTAREGHSLPQLPQ